MISIMENYLRSVLDQVTVNHLAILLPLFLELGGLTSAVIIDNYISSAHKRIMVIIVTLVLSLIGQNYFENMLVVGEPRIHLRTALAVYGYCIRPVILVLFLYIVCPQKHFPLAWVLAGVNAAIYMTAFFSDLSFIITDGNHYIGGPLNNACLCVSLLLLTYLVLLVIREYGSISRREVLIPVINALFIIAALVLDGNVGTIEQIVTFLTIAIVCDCVFFYIWLHLQLVREQENELRAQQRIRIMVTQIQPHFLYNTIATFKALCGRDPKRAGEVADKFAAYLRQNMDYLDVPGCIEFSRELEHTRIYADIEMVRFDNIRVEYDIMDDDFKIPPLTVQPIVENAIRHGVRIREDGRVRVTARRLENCHEIVIEDNGTGLDVSCLSEFNKGEHIGINNVRDRVGKMCGGTFDIVSREGEGTRVTIRIPLNPKAERNLG